MGDYTWTAEGACLGATDSSWGEAPNWSPNGVPSNGDSVTIPDTDYDGNGFDGGFNPTNIPTVTLKNLNVGDLGLIGGTLTVQESFTWTGGSIDDGAVIIVSGTGQISGLDGLDSQPSVSNNSGLTVAGTVTVSGGQLVFASGGTVTVTGTLALNAGGFTSIAGSPATVTNTGTITVTGSSVISEDINVIHKAGTIAIGSGATLSIGDWATLYLDGGTITGSGALSIDGSGSFGQPGGGGGGTVVPNASTTVAHLLMSAGAVSPPSKSTSTATLNVSSTFTWSGGELDGHLVLQANSVSAITAAVLQAGRLDNAGVLTVSAAGVWQFEGSTPPALTNSGRIVLTGAGSISNNAAVAATNSGVIEKTGSGTTSTVEIDITSTGAVVITSGTLTLSFATLTIAGGQLRLAGTTLGDNAGTLALTGGTAGGVLAGWGTIDVQVANDGWIEPAAQGFTFAGDYSQATAGNIVVSPAALASGANPLLRFTGVNRPQFAGSFWGLS